jgi:hypothetical protein
MASYRAIWAAPLVAIGAAVYLASVRPIALAVAGPLLCLWLAAPAITWWASRPLTRRVPRLTAEQTFYLRSVSRKTWAYFQRYAGPEHHYLPADNYQEHPVAVVAPRTSPTNMGLSLLANMSAYDLGYIPAGELIERSAKTIATMQSLERYRGHFFNWYDTQSLKPLPPLYVSSVDSGNLAGHLLIVRAGLLSLPDHPILNAQWLHGFQDTMRVLRDAATDDASGLFSSMQKLVGELPTTLAAAQAWMQQLAQCVRESDGAVPDGERPHGNDVLWWSGALLQQSESALEELALLAPWIALQRPAGLPDKLLHDRDIPTLRELASLERELVPELDRMCDAESAPETRAQLEALARAIATASRHAQDRMTSIARLAAEAGELAHIEYDFLYDEARHLLAVGYNVGERRRDTAYYDLLASEARFSVFVGIAQGKLPQDSWFALGRMLTAKDGEATLLSWSGSMFEYLMPLLVMPTYEHTFLDQTYRTAVARQIEYGRQRGVPWGISESG